MSGMPQGARDGGAANVQLYGMPWAHGCAGAANVQDVRYAVGAWMRRSGECTGCNEVINYATYYLQVTL
jgi:hypothetical protein